MALIFFFVDGLGLGNETVDNPVFSNPLPAFTQLSGGQILSNKIDRIRSDDITVSTIDARLTVEGLPQSGTGQVSMFTGQNASKLIGKHFGPYPHSKTKVLLEEKSIFKRIKENSGSSYFMNAFPEIFFDHAKKRNRWSTTTLMTKLAGYQINGEEQVRNGEALTAEIFQDVWRTRLNIDLPKISPEIAAERVINKAKTHDLVLIEYYLTDKAGHVQDYKQAISVLERLDSFLMALIASISNDHTLLLTSDHGNIEDLSTKTHTMNDVPLLVKGKNAGAFSEVRSLVDVTPAIMDYLS